MNPVSIRFTNVHALHFNVQLGIQTPQLIKLCILKFIHICMYVVMYDIICLVGCCLLCHLNERIRWPPNSSQQSTHVRYYRRNPTKNVGKQNKCFLTRYTNLIHVDHPRIVKPLLLLRGQPLQTPCLPIPLPPDSA